MLNIEILNFPVPSNATKIKRPIFKRAFPYRPLYEVPAPSMAHYIVLPEITFGGNGCFSLKAKSFNSAVIG